MVKGVSMCGCCRVDVTPTCESCVKEVIFSPAVIYSNISCYSL